VELRSVHVALARENCLGTSAPPPTATQHSSVGHQHPHLEKPTTVPDAQHPHHQQPHTASDASTTRNSSTRAGTAQTHHCCH